MLDGLLAPLKTYTLWLRVGLYALCFLAGVYCTHKFYQAETARQVNEARATERDVVAIGNDHEAGYLSRMRESQEIANGKLKVLQNVLNHVPSFAVPVPADWLSAPSRMPAVAGDAGRTQPAAAPVAEVATADCRDVVLTCEKNRLEVCEPNAEQVKEIQIWYRDLRQRFNR